MFPCQKTIKKNIIYFSFAKWTNASTVSTKYKAPLITQSEPNAKPTLKKKVKKKSLIKLRLIEF